MWMIAAALAADPWGGVTVGAAFDPAGWRCHNESCVRDGEYAGLPVSIVVDVCEGRAREVSARWPRGFEDPGQGADDALARLAAALVADGFTPGGQAGIFDATFTRFTRGDVQRELTRIQRQDRTSLFLAEGPPGRCATPGATTIHNLPAPVRDPEAALERWGRDRIPEVLTALHGGASHIVVADATRAAVAAWPKRARLELVSVSGAIVWETWGAGERRVGFTALRGRDWRYLFRGRGGGVPTDGAAWGPLRPWLDHTVGVVGVGCSSLPDVDRATMVALDPNIGPKWDVIGPELTKHHQEACAAFEGQRVSSAAALISRYNLVVRDGRDTLGTIEVRLDREEPTFAVFTPRP